MSTTPVITIPEQSRSVWQRLEYSHRLDSKKYSKKGSGKYVGYILLTCYVTLFPTLLKVIWPFLEENLDGRTIIALGISSVNVSVMIAYNTVMYFIYVGKYPFLEQYRVSRVLFYDELQKAWPWQENPELWRKQIKKSILINMRNALLIGIPFTFVQGNTTHYETRLSQWPSTIEIVWQCALFILVEDLFFYLTHAMLHQPQFYWIHKHHHEYVNTVTMAAQHSHPIEYIVTGIPTVLGFKVLSFVCPVHAVTIFTFFFFRLIEGCDAHSGYEWSWAQSTLLPFSAGSTYHNFHHSKNTGNYGSFFVFWDTIFGTNQEFVKYVKRQNQKIKKSQD